MFVNSCCRFRRLDSRYVVLADEFRVAGVGSFCRFVMEKPPAPGRKVAPPRHRAKIMQRPKNRFTQFGQFLQRSAGEKFGHPVKMNHIRLLHPRVATDIHAQIIKRKMGVGECRPVGPNLLQGPFPQFFLTAGVRIPRFSQRSRQPRIPRQNPAVHPDFPQAQMELQGAFEGSSGIHAGTEMDYFDLIAPIKSESGLRVEPSGSISGI